MSSATALPSVLVRRVVNGSRDWTCLRQCRKPKWPQVSSATTLLSVLVRRAVNGNRHWTCLRQCREPRWPQMSSATALPSVLVRRVVNGSRDWTCLRQCRKPKWPQMSSATKLQSVRAKRVVNGSKHWFFFEAMSTAKVLPDMVTYNALLDCREIGSSSLGGHIFQHGLLKILQGSSAFEDLKLDLHDHSEGAARLALQWWLSTTVAKRLEVSDRLDCIVITGYGQSRQAWDRTNVQAAVLVLLKGLKLDAKILPENLVTSKDWKYSYLSLVYFTLIGRGRSAHR